MGWYNASWSHRAQVDIDPTYVDESVPIIPVYLSGLDATWWANVASDGDDIIVTTSDGTTLRDYYLVSINTGTSTGLIIVNVDGYISTSATTTLYIYCGNAGATAGSDAAATFSDYAAFYLPGMTTDDLSSGGRNLTAVNSPGTAASGFEGLTEATYNGSNQYHRTSVGTQAATNWPVTLETIATPSNEATTTSALGLGDDNSVWSRAQIAFRGGDAGDPIAGQFRGTSGSISIPYSTTNYAASTDYYVAIVRTGATGSGYTYINGTLEATESSTITAPDFQTFAIGAYYRDGVASDYFPGSVSFAAISAETRSTNYMATMYDAWYTSAFRTYGATEDQPGSGDTGWVEFSTAAQVASTAIWTNKDNALTSLVTYASASPGEDEQTYQLDLTNASGLSGVTGTITSAEVEIAVTGEDTGTDEIQANQVQFVYSGSTIGTNKGTATQIGDAELNFLTFTMDVPTAAQATHSTFGVRLQFTNVGTDGNALVKVYRVRVRMVYGSSGITGDGSLTLPAMTVSGSGTVPIVGDGSITLPALEVSGGGVIPIVGDGAITLPALSVSGGGTIPIVGDGSITLPAFEIDGSGAIPIVGDGSITLPAFEVEGTNIHAITGGGTLVLPGFEVHGHFALAGVTDWYLPQAASSEAGAGGTWIDPEDIYDPSPQQFAYISLTAGQVSNELRGANFAPVFPANSELSGIEFRFRSGILNDVNTHTADNTIRLVVDGAPAGDNVAKAQSNEWGVYALRYYGGPGEMFGLSLTKADVQEADFGVGIVAENIDPTETDTSRVFTVEMRFYYDPKTTGDGSITLPNFQIAGAGPYTECTCCEGYTMANLLDMRKLLVKRSGHYDLVTDAEAGDWSDNGADEFIRAAARRLDDLFQYHKSEAWLYHKLSAGQSLVTFQNSRIVKEVWIANASGSRTRLQRLTPRELRDLYTKNELSAETPGTPLYWASGVTMLAPSQLEETASSFLADGLKDYDLVVFGEDYPNKSIWVMPPVDATTTVEVLAEWYSKELCEDSDVSFWSQYPELLVRAARSEIEVDLHRNTQGRKDFDEPLMDRLQKLEWNLRAEEASGPHSDFVMKG